MIDCPHRTEQGCQHVDAGVGGLVILHESVCPACVERYPDANKRPEGYVVASSIYAHRMRRGLENGPPPKPPSLPPRTDHTTHERRNLADELLATARNVPRVRNAPIVANGEDRLAICEGCDQWKRGKCVASCSCKTRPRPMAETGPDCPRGLWKRAPA